MDEGTHFNNQFEIENEFKNTYPIAICLKAGLHDAIEKGFIEEFFELGSGWGNIFYCDKQKKNVTVHLEDLALLGDQPKRRLMNYFMLGNSLFSSRFMAVTQHNCCIIPARAGEGPIT